MKMTPEEWQEMMGAANQNKPGLMDDPALRKTAEKFLRQFERKKRKHEIDSLLLWGLVNVIEIMGFSQKQAFKMAGDAKGSRGVSAKEFWSEARAKNLWFETKKNDPGTIEDIRQAHAYRYVNELTQWIVSDQSTELPSITSKVVQRVKEKEPALYNWAFQKAYWDYTGEEYEDFKPDYSKHPETSNEETLALMRQIALSD